MKKKIFGLAGIIAFAVIIGLVMTGCPPSGNSHQCSFEGEWKTSETQHWKECVAPGCSSPAKKSQEASHVGNPCDTCGYKTASSSSISTAFATNGKLSIDQDVTGTTFTATIKDTNTYADTPVRTYTWFLEGAKQDGKTTASIELTNLEPGGYFGLVVVTINAGVYSQGFFFQVEE